jgi:hypothetical protein
MPSNVYIENSQPEIREAGGILTKKNIKIVGGAGVFDISGAASANFGNITVSGAPTFTSKSSIVDVTGSTLTINSTQSGSAFLLDAAAGSTITLPTDSPGLKFTFYVVTTVTSNSYKVIIGSASSYFQGYLNVPVSGGTAKYFFGDGSSLLSINLNGSTTGGLLGGDFTVTCIKAGLWQCTGNVEGSGTVATPFATS